MKRLILLMMGALWATLLVPTNAFAFVVTADRTVIFVGESVRLTLSGEALGTTQFFVGVTPDFTYFDQATPTISYVGSTTGPAPFVFPEVDFTQTPSIFLVLASQVDFDTGLELPFDLVNGPILDVTLDGITPTTPVTTIAFDVCTSLDCILERTPTRFTIDITIQQRTTNNVPEPATLWLAAAALIAGGVVFRNHPKRS